MIAQQIHSLYCKMPRSVIAHCERRTEIAFCENLQEYTG